MPFSVQAYNLEEMAMEELAICASTNAVTRVPKKGWEVQQVGWSLSERKGCIRNMMQD